MTYLIYLLCHTSFSIQYSLKLLDQNTNGNSKNMQITQKVNTNQEYNVQGVAELYLELKKKGIEFPPPTDDDILLVEKTR